MQKDSGKLEKANLQVVAISYDSMEILAKFAAKSKVKFPLLSDKDSKTITAFGILNERARGRTKGIPHPGTFLIDQKGIVRAKLFREGYRQRHTSEELIEAAKKHLK